jgi:uncharacterized protein YciI
MTYMSFVYLQCACAKKKDSYGTVRVNISAFLFFSLKKKHQVKNFIHWKICLYRFSMTSISPKLYIVQYDYVENVMEKRAPFREAHLAHLGKQVERGNMILGGTVNQPPTGALLIFRNLKIDDIEQVIHEDPYVINGIVTKYTINPYIAVAGDPLLKYDLIKV